MKHLIALLAMLPVCLATAAEKAPAVEIRVQSVHDLLGYADYIGGLAGQPDAAKQFAELVKAFGGDKGVIEGVDLKKPVGAYAVLTPELVTSQVIVMLPVANEKDFVNLLKTRLSLDAKAEKDGAYKLEIPKVPVPVYFRIHKHYACFTVMDSGNIKSDSLIDPDTFFKSKVDDIVRIDLHIDRIPEDFRKMALAQMELKLADALETLKKGNAGERLGHFLASEGLTRSAKCLLEECRTLSLKLNVEPKTDTIALTLSLVPKSGSDFQKTLKELPNRPATAALAANAENPVVAVAIKAGLPESLKKEFGKKVDEALNEAVQNSGGDKMAMERVMETLTPTLRDGDYELGMAITGTADGKLRLLAAMKAVDGKEVEKLAKEFAAFIPEDIAKIDFDVAKLGLGNLHKITVKNDDLKKLYGNDTVWAAFGDSVYVVGFEPDGADVKRFAALKPGTTEMIAVRVSVTRLMAMVDPQGDPKALKEAVEASFGGSVKPGADEIRFTVTGGDELTVKLAAKGKAIAFLAKLDQLKKGN